MIYGWGTLSRQAIHLWTPAGEKGYAMRQPMIVITAGLGLLLMCATAGSAVAAEFVCPKEDIKETQCMGPKDCLYPHPTECGKFIKCEVNSDGETGRPTIQDCPADLDFNNETKECDYPENAGCEDKTGLALGGQLPIGRVRAEWHSSQVTVLTAASRHSLRTGTCEHSG